MPKTLTIEEILSKNQGIDPEKLREFLEFARRLLETSPPSEPIAPGARRRLVVGDPDDDDSRTVRLRYSRR